MDIVYLTGEDGIRRIQIISANTGEKKTYKLCNGKNDTCNTRAVSKKDGKCAKCYKIEIVNSRL